MKLVIDRTKWLHGEGAVASKLLRRQDKKQCCIGFLCSAYGVPDSAMEDVGGSQKLSHKLPSWLKVESYIGENAEYHIKDDLFSAYEANDSQKLDEALREESIIAIFAKHDVEVEFIN